MIDYILALSLKKAGFPQNPSGHDERPNMFYTTLGGTVAPSVIDHDRLYPHDVYIPTFEEIVAELGDRFQWMTIDIVKSGTLMNPVVGEKTGWYAGDKHLVLADDNNIGIKVWGKTPDAAVAELYLEVKKRTCTKN